MCNKPTKRQHTTTHLYTNVILSEKTTNRHMYTHVYLLQIIFTP